MTRMTNKMGTQIYDSSFVVSICEVVLVISIVFTKFAAVVAFVTETDVAFVDVDDSKLDPAVVINISEVDDDSKVDPAVVINMSGVDDSKVDPAVVINISGVVAGFDLSM